MEEVVHGYNWLNNSIDVRMSVGELTGWSKEKNKLINCTIKTGQKAEIPLKYGMVVATANFTSQCAVFAINKNDAKPKCITGDSFLSVFDFSRSEFGNIMIQNNASYIVELSMQVVSNM